MRAYDENGRNLVLKHLFNDDRGAETAFKDWLRHNDIKLNYDLLASNYKALRAQCKALCEMRDTQLKYREALEKKDEGLFKHKLQQPPLKNQKLTKAFKALKAQYSLFY